MHMDKEQFLQLLETQQGSGLSIQSYCQQHNIPFSSFSYWKKKFITSSGSNSSPKKLVPIKVQSVQNQNHLNYYHDYHVDGSNRIRKHV